MFAAPSLNTIQILRHGYVVDAIELSALLRLRSELLYSGADKQAGGVRSIVRCGGNLARHTGQMGTETNGKFQSTGPSERP
jgi:hypothetical protein